MINIMVETSARHVHLTTEQVRVLFPDTGLTFKKELSIKGQYACNEKVFMKGPRETLAVTVLGPTRDVSQIELSKTDIIRLGISCAPVRLSGDTKNAPKFDVFTKHGSVTIPTIVSLRHLHVPEYNMLPSGFPHINIWLKGTRGEYIINDVPVRPTKGCENYTLHLDTDEANAFGPIIEAGVEPYTIKQLSKHFAKEVILKWYDNISPVTWIQRIPAYNIREDK